MIITKHSVLFILHNYPPNHTDALSILVYMFASIDRKVEL